MTEVLEVEEPIIFINYRRTDAGWPADLLTSELGRSFGASQVFQDVRGIDAGDDFVTVLDSQLRRATVLIVLIGSNWLRVGDKFGRRRLDQEQDWVRREIRMALQKPGCRVIPVLIDGAELPDESEALPEDISALLTRQRFYLRQACSDADIEALSREIEKAGFPRLATLTTSPVRVLPRLAYGTWTLRKAIDEQAIDWSNSTLKFTDQEETADGLLFRGTFTWRRLNALVGTEEFTGHYVADTRQLIFDGTAVSDRILAMGSYSAVLSLDGRTIVEGRWGSTQLKDDPASPGRWEAFR